MENLGTHELRNLVNDAADEAVNIGYRVADRLHRWREKRAIAAGREPILVPTEGYGRAASDGNPGWVRVIARALYKTVNLERLLQVVEGTQDTANPMRGWRSFTATAMSDAPVTIVIDGTKYEAYTDRGGVLDVKLSIDLEPGMHEVIMYVPGSRAVATSVYIVPESQKLGVIMDVDDTVMVTMLPRPLVAAWNSFILDEHARIPTPGMAVMTTVSAAATRMRRSCTCPPAPGTSPRPCAASSAATATRAARSCSPTGAHPRPLVPLRNQPQGRVPAPTRRGIPADEVDPRR